MKYTKISTETGVNVYYIRKAIMYIRRHAIQHPELYGDLGIRYQACMAKSVPHKGSGYKYVHKHKSRYSACITSSEKYKINKAIHVGIYKNAIDAAYAIDQAIRDNNLPMPLNFPDQKCPHNVLVIYREAIKVDNTKGIYHKPYWIKPWQVVVGTKHLGSYNTIEEAAKARDSWLKAQQ